MKDFLLGIIDCEDGKGESIALECYTVLMTYDIKPTQIFGICADTTSANTGNLINMYLLYFIS